MVSIACLLLGLIMQQSMREDRLGLFLRNPFTPSDLSVSRQKSER